MEQKKPSNHAYTDVMMKKAHLDWEMECLQTKIKCKNEENSKLENQISERKNELEKLRKSVSTSCEREEKVKNNIDMLRNSRTISEGLLMTMKNQLRILEEKRNDTKNIRKNIIEKYSKLFESHAKIYSNLPWVKKIKELEMSVKNRQIHLDILKLEYSSFKKKISLFHKIQDQRKMVAIIRLAKCLVARNNIQKEVEGLFSKQKELQSRIILLEEDKVKLKEKIDLKIKEALDEARGRVVKKHVGESTGEKHTMVAGPPEVVTAFGTNLKPKNESIFSRLGLSIPDSMKRLLAPSSRVLVSGLMKEQFTKKDVPVVEKLSTHQEKSFAPQVQTDKPAMEERAKALDNATDSKGDHPKKKNPPITEKINRVEEKSGTSEVKKVKKIGEEKSSSASRVMKRPSTTSSNISEKISHMMEVIRKNKVPAVEKIGSGQEKVQPSEEKGCVPDNEKSEIMEIETVSTPVSAIKPTLQAKETENKRNTDQTGRNKLKNKVNKDLNLESTSTVQGSDNPKSCNPGHNQNVVLPEELMKDNGNEQISQPIAPEKHVTFVDDSEEIATEKEILTEEQDMPHVLQDIDPPEQIAQEKTVINEADMNDSNLSVLDNISVVSSTFTNENKNRMAKSPDFLNQIPQGYCFSPLLSPSKADSISEASSVKGAKSPPNNFPNTTPIDSHLFPMDTEPAAGPSSDFSSFFGSSSPKKNEKSSKNFFQLFG
ncbi:putative leucine-rich repeat-containing protein DDB_G0290503 [Halyomorpha halys]|uniref:putative leucine-rich repeat-containing protein DDB_G0290503 n=1 Tax=Halyomorpha halys TaxID=286706 RepID=UPI0006D4ECE7|nr:calponin homology domain-containing protein DDB_G0272472-like [Halyomorpha halys]